MTICDNLHIHVTNNQSHCAFFEKLIKCWELSYVNFQAQPNTLVNMIKKTVMYILQNDKYFIMFDITYYVLEGYENAIQR